MTHETLERLAIGAGIGFLTWVLIVVTMRYLWSAWVMGRVCYRLAALLRDAPRAPFDAVPFGPHATFWWALRRAIRPARTQRQVAFLAAAMGRWEPWMGRPAVR